MKPLAERIAFRAKQREENQKREANSGNTLPAADEAKFNPAEYLKQKPKPFTEGLKNLSDEQLGQLEELESAGDKRANVLSAVKDARAKKSAAVSGWSSNAG